MIEDIKAARVVYPCCCSYMKKRIQPPRKVKSISNFRELQENFPSEYSERDIVMSEEDKNPGLNQVSDTMLMIQYLREQDEKRRQ